MFVKHYRSKNCSCLPLKRRFVEVPRHLDVAVVGGSDDHEVVPGVSAQSRGEAFQVTLTVREIQRLVWEKNKKTLRGLYVTFVHFCGQIVYCSGVSVVFKGGANPKFMWGRKPIILAISSRKLYGTENKWTEKRVRVPSAPLDWTL